MLHTFFTSTFALCLPVVFGLIMAVRHTGPGVVQHFSEGWTIASWIGGVNRLVQLSIAVLLPLPQARFWNALLEHARSISAAEAAHPRKSQYHQRHSVAASLRNALARCAGEVRQLELD